MRRDRIQQLLVVLLACCVAACGTTTRRADGSSRNADDKASARASAAGTNVQLGQGYMEQGRLELAMEKLTRAIETDPKSTSAHTVIAVLYERISDPVNARIHYKRASELSPRAGDVLNNYGTFLCKQGEYPAADQLFVRALADPFYKTPAVAHANRGACAASSGDLQVAEDSLRRAVQLSPNNPDALFSMARVSYLKGDYMNARAFVQRYESTGRAAVDGLLLGYEVEQKLGNVRGANEYRQRLLVQFPDSEAARRLNDRESPQ